MKNINNKGNPKSPIWIIVERPYEKDAEKGYLFSSGLGYVYDKMLAEAGINDYYICARASDLEDKYSFTIIENNINYYKPPILIPLGETGKHLCPALANKPKKGMEEKTELEKFAGNLLTSPKLNYSHYVIPSLMPDKIVQDWALRDITISIDLQRARDECKYWLMHNKQIQPLPQRRLLYELSFEETIYHIRDFRSNHSTENSILSTDIESIYSNRKSAFWPHPGYPVTIGIANSPDFGISFNFWWPTLEQNLMLWRELDALFSDPNIKFLGQNFFIFDMPRINALGFNLNSESILDTMIRHHILWPELPHKLQFQTKQYTREPYYKDEGKHWNFKDMKALKRYNCLDVCCTYEIFLEQEKEFDQRSHLR